MCVCVRACVRACVCFGGVQVWYGVSEADGGKLERLAEALYPELALHCSQVMPRPMYLRYLLVSLYLRYLRVSNTPRGALPGARPALQPGHPSYIRNSRSNLCISDTPRGALPGARPPLQPGHPPDVRNSVYLRSHLRVSNRYTAARSAPGYTAARSCPGR